MAGSDSLVWNVEDMKRFENRLRIAADPLVAGQVVGRALYRAAEKILREAKAITPVEFGNLRRSGHIEGPLMTPEGIAVFIKFGGAAAPYAFWVHERLGIYHAPPTQAKFLEKPFVANRSSARDELILGIAKLLRGDFA